MLASREGPRQNDGATILASRADSGQTPFMDSPPHSATILVDFENIFYHFAKNIVSGGGDVCGPVIAWLRNLKSFVNDDLHQTIVSQEAYADFERIPEEVQTDLYLLGADTHHVAGTDHKNAADMKLCVDALEILYTRPDIGTFILVAGDRDYIPLIRHLRKQGRAVRVVGFTGSMAGDLVTTVGIENYLQGERFLPGLPPAPPPAPAKVGKASSAIRPAKSAQPSLADELTPEINDNDRRAMELIFRDFPGKKEIWVTPFLHHLRAEMPQLAEYERREIVNRMQALGAVVVEKRPGHPNPYSVLTINWNHPLVRELHGTGGA